MSTDDRNWQKLATAARSLPLRMDVAAPFGFSTRMAGLAMSTPRSASWALFEKFAIRGLIAACACGAAAAAFGYSSWNSDHENDTGADDGVTEVFDLS
ncbi:MAG TPA: hypothetical protein VGM73_15675 [Candidatus Didemnitutus sp.]|jgi:hypothetical protein